MGGEVGTDWLVGSDEILGGCGVFTVEFLLFFEEVLQDFEFVGIGWSQPMAKRFA